jgi:hypothetical protein
MGGLGDEVDIETFSLIEIQNDLRILRLALEALESKMPGEYCVKR